MTYREKHAQHDTGGLKLLLRAGDKFFLNFENQEMKCTVLGQDGQYTRIAFLGPIEIKIRREMAHLKSGEEK